MPPRTETSPPGGGRLFRFWLFAGVLAADQISKLVVRRFLAPGESHPVVPPYLFLTHVANPGAAFGLMPHHSWLFLGAGVAVLLAVAVVLVLWEDGSGPARAGLAVTAGGVAGNLVDRLHTGRVVDFIDVRVWPVFNLADTAIVVGLALVAFVWLGGERACRRRK